MSAYRDSEYEPHFNEAEIATDYPHLDTRTEALLLEGIVQNTQSIVSRPAGDSMDLPFIPELHDFSSKENSPESPTYDTQYPSFSSSPWAMSQTRQLPPQTPSTPYSRSFSPTSDLGSFTYSPYSQMSNFPAAPHAAFQPTHHLHQSSPDPGNPSNMGVAVRSAPPTPAGAPFAIYSDPRPYQNASSPSLELPFTTANAAPFHPPTKAPNPFDVYENACLLTSAINDGSFEAGPPVWNIQREKARRGPEYLQQIVKQWTEFTDVELRMWIDAVSDWKNRHGWQRPVVDVNEDGTDGLDDEYDLLMGSWTHSDIPRIPADEAAHWVDQFTQQHGATSGEQVVHPGPGAGIGSHGGSGTAFFPAQGSSSSVLRNRNRSLSMSCAEPQDVLLCQMQRFRPTHKRSISDVDGTS